MAQELAEKKERYYVPAKLSACVISSITTTAVSRAYEGSDALVWTEAPFRSRGDSCFCIRPRLAFLRESLSGSLRSTNHLYGPSNDHHSCLRTPRLSPAGSAPIQTLGINVLPQDDSGCPACEWQIAEAF